MPTVKAITSLATVLALGALSGQPRIASAQAEDKARIVQMLTDGSALNDRASALQRIRRIPVESRGEEIFKALLAEVDRQNQVLQNRRRSSDQGTPLPNDHSGGEYLLELLRIVCEHESDPRLIPHLVPFVGVGGGVIEVLAKFGERAVGEVVGLAASETSQASDVSSALYTLRRMLESQPTYPLAAQSRRRIIQVAKQRLNGKQPSAVVWRAADLAIATGDSSLRARVNQLATDPAVSRSLGVEAEFLSQTQELAKEALQRSRSN
jgi:hypothetical protein